MNQTFSVNKNKYILQNAQFVGMDTRTYTSISQQVCNCVLRLVEIINMESSSDTSQ